MKVVLTQDVRNVGKTGDLVKVADGYARNFLFPRRFAIEATERRVKEFKHLQAMAEAKKKKAFAGSKDIAAKLAGVTVTVKMAAGEHDKLFGSVTAQELSNQLYKAGHNVDKRDIEITEPIKTLGEHTIKVKVATGVEAEVKVKVEKEA